MEFSSAFDKHQLPEGLDRKPRAAFESPPIFAPPPATRTDDHAMIADQAAVRLIREERLPDPGERVNVNLRLAGTTLVVASNVPTDEPCEAGGYGWLNYLNFETGLAVNGGPEGGMAGVQVPDTLIVGNVLTANPNGIVTSHVETGVVGQPLDILIPVAAPQPLVNTIKSPLAKP